MKIPGLHKLYTQIYNIPRGICTVLNGTLKSMNVLNFGQSLDTMRLRPRYTHFLRSYEKQSYYFELSSIDIRTCFGFVNTDKIKQKYKDTVSHSQKGYPDVNNNMPKKSEKSSRARKRKAPPRPHLVARSIRGSSSSTSAGSKTKRSAKKNYKKSALVMQSTAKKLRKAKNLRTSPATSGRKKKKSQECSEQSSTSPDNTEPHASVETKNKKQKIKDESAGSKLKSDPSPGRYVLRNTLTATKSNKPCLSKTPNKNRVAHPDSKISSDESPIEWPKVSEIGRRKSLRKGAVTEIVRNKQTGTVAKRTRQRWADIVANRVGTSNEQNPLLDMSADPNPDPVRSWAAVATVKPRGRPRKSSKENVEERSKITIKKSDERLTENCVKSRSHEIITRMRSVQKRKSAKVGALVKCDTTSNGINGQLRWKIDQMPENLMFTKPPLSIVSLIENQIEADRTVGSASSPVNMNKCNNRRFCLKDFMTGTHGETSKSKQVTGELKTDTEISNLLKDVTFQPNPIEDSDQIPQSEKSKKEPSSPKKISQRYRALLRGEDSKMTAKALSEATARKKKDAAIQKLNSILRGNQKKQRRKWGKQRSQDELRSAEDSEGCSQNVLQQQGTSTSFLDELSVPTPDLTDITERTRKGGNKKRQMIVCEDSGEEEVKDADDTEDDKRGSTDGSKDVNNSFIRDKIIDKSGIIFPLDESQSLGLDVLRRKENKEEKFARTKSPEGEQGNIKDQVMHGSTSTIDMSGVDDIITGLPRVFSDPDLTGDHFLDFLASDAAPAIDLDWWMFYFFGVSDNTKGGKQCIENEIQTDKEVTSSQKLLVDYRIENNVDVDNMQCDPSIDALQYNPSIDTLQYDPINGLGHISDVLNQEEGNSLLNN